MGGRVPPPWEARPGSEDLRPLGDTSTTDGFIDDLCRTSVGLSDERLTSLFTKNDVAVREEFQQPIQNRLIISRDNPKVVKMVGLRVVRGQVMVRVYITMIYHAPWQ